MKPRRFLRGDYDVFPQTGIFPDTEKGRAKDVEWYPLAHRRPPSWEIDFQARFEQCAGSEGFEKAYVHNWLYGRMNVDEGWEYFAKKYSYELKFARRRADCEDLLDRVAIRAAYEDGWNRMVQLLSRP